MFPASLDLNFIQFLRPRDFQDALLNTLGLSRPKLLATYCCSQFLVHRRLLRRRSLDFFRTAHGLLDTWRAVPACAERRGAEQVKLCHLYAAWPLNVSKTFTSAKRLLCFLCESRVDRGVSLASHL